MDRRSSFKVLHNMVPRGSKRKRSQSPENKKRLTPDSSLNNSDQENQLIMDIAIDSPTRVLSCNNSNQAINHESETLNAPIAVEPIPGNIVWGWKKASNKEIEVSDITKSLLIQRAKEFCTLMDIPYDNIFKEIVPDNRQSISSSTLTDENLLPKLSTELDQSTKENRISYQITEEEYSSLFDSSPISSPRAKERMDSSASQLLNPEDDDFLSNLDVDNLIAS